MNDIINVVIDCDESYKLPTMTMLFSLRKNLPKETRIHCFYAMYNDQQNNFYNDFRKVLYSGDNLSVLRIPHIFDNQNFGRWNNQIALRILVPYYIPDGVCKYVRFDGDIVIDGNITTFYNTTLNNEAVAGTKECNLWRNKAPIYPYMSGLPYINSGSLLFNVTEWKKKYPTHEILEEQISKIPFDLLAWDQDIINYLFLNNRYIFDDDKYMRFCDNYHHIDNDYKSKKPIVFHFAGVHKPWITVGNPRYRHVWWKYAKKIYPISQQFILHFKRFFYVFCYPIRVLKRLFHQNASR